MGHINSPGSDFVSSNSPWGKSPPVSSSATSVLEEDLRSITDPNKESSKLFFLADILNYIIDFLLSLFHRRTVAAERRLWAYYMTTTTEINAFKASVTPSYYISHFGSSEVAQCTERTPHAFRKKYSFLGRNI